MLGANVPKELLKTLKVHETIKIKIPVILSKPHHLLLESPTSERWAEGKGQLPKHSPQCEPRLNQKPRQQDMNRASHGFALKFFYMVEINIYHTKHIEK